MTEPYKLLNLSPISDMSDEEIVNEIVKIQHAILSAQERATLIHHLIGFRVQLASHMFTVESGMATEHDHYQVSSQPAQSNAIVDFVRQNEEIFRKGPYL